MKSQEFQACEMKNIFFQMKIAADTDTLNKH